MNRGHGWQLRAEGRIPVEVTAEQIERDLQDYAIQYPHRALLDGIEVARSGSEVKRHDNSLDDAIGLLGTRSRSDGRR